eukprot:jgi/Ulvmu1/8198/UM041_0007.1
MSGDIGNIKTALLESAQSEKLPPLPEDETSSLWSRPIRRSVTQAAHGQGKSHDDGEEQGDSIFLRKMYPKGRIRSYTFMERFRNAANAYSPTSTHEESHAVTFADSTFEHTVSGPLLQESKFTALSDWSLGAHGHAHHAADMQGCLHASVLRAKSLEQQNVDALKSKLARARTAFEVFFTLACFVGAGAVAYADRHRHREDFLQIVHIPLFLWLIMAALIFPTIHFARWAMDALVTLFEAVAVRSGLTNVHYVLIGMSDALRLLAVSVLMEVMLLLVMHERKYDLPDKNIYVIYKVGLCLIIFAIVELFKTLSCRLLSLRVNAESMFENLQAAIEKERVLGKVMDRKVLAGGDEAEHFAQIAKLRDIPEWSVPHYLTDLYQLSLSSDPNTLMLSSFTDRITDLVAQFKDMPEEDLDEHASHAAEYCWLTARRDLTRERLFREDFEALLTDKPDADFTFSLFDLDGDGYVTEPEVHSRFQHIYRERRNLARTLQDNDQVIGTLEALVGATMHVLAAFSYAGIFGTDVGHLVISLSSMGVACAFVFGNSLRTIYESVVFLFIIRPYQVGDAIIYKGQLHTVKNFGLLSTQFMRCDGCKLWVPNQSLMSSDINNVTQSHELQDRLVFEVDSGHFTPDLCADLASRISVMMAQEPNRHLFDIDFVPFSYIIAVTDPLKYKVGLCYQLAFNGEKFAQVVEARTLINHTIGEWQRHHKIIHSTSVQPLYNFTGAS